jgi:hypothetical protein
LHVYAAGNSNQNTDSSPTYPAAYDNRGIISVLASDQNDAGASFTNYGLASVDIAAPGPSAVIPICRLDWDTRNAPGSRSGGPFTLPAGTGRCPSPVDENSSRFPGPLFD